MMKAWTVMHQTMKTTCTSPIAAAGPVHTRVSIVTVRWCCCVRAVAAMCVAGSCPGDNMSPVERCFVWLQVHQCCVHPHLGHLVPQHAVMEPRPIQLVYLPQLAVVALPAHLAWLQLLPLLLLPPELAVTPLLMLLHVVLEFLALLAPLPPLHPPQLLLRVLLLMHPRHHHLQQVCNLLAWPATLLPSCLFQNFQPQMPYTTTRGCASLHVGCGCSTHQTGCSALNDTMLVD